jgi:hypothetical protein
VSESEDWVRYRALCDRGDVLSRWLVEQTAGLLEADGDDGLARRVRRIAAGTPLPRPADHLGGAATEFFEARLALAEVRAVAAAVRAAAAEPGRRLPGGRGLGGVTEAWQEYADWLDGTHPRSPLPAPVAAVLREGP